MSKVNGEKCCFCINLKIGCYIIAYFLLVINSQFVQTAVSTVISYLIFTKELDLEKYVEGNIFLKILAILLYYGLLVVIAVTVVAFTIVLLIGLHTESRKLIKMYLIFETVVLVIFICVCFFIDFFMNSDPDASIQRGGVAALVAYFTYVIKCYWITLGPNDTKTIATIA